jgi:CysZ protein
MRLITPALHAIAQLDDHVFVGVVLRSVAWAASSFAALIALVVWGAGRLAAGHGAWTWLAGLLSGAGAAILAVFLFLPLATVIATLFIDRVAAAVERRFYPWLPPARAAPMGAQIWDGITLGLRVLGMQIAALVLALLLPGVGFLLGWLVAAWAFGRGLFVAVAMRRMNRADATALYARRRWMVLSQGGIATACSLVPVLNLLAPVLGTACMVHVLHEAANPPPGL